MSSYDTYHSQSYAPSAPVLPQEPPYTTPTTAAADTSNYHYGNGSGHGHGHGSASPVPSHYYYYHESGYGQVSSSGYSAVSSSGYSTFPPGTHLVVIRSFQMVDNDRSGFVDENELHQALSSGFQKFNLGTIRLLMFLFKNPNEPLRIGPKEFAALWSCLGHWRKKEEAITLTANTTNTYTINQ